MSESRNTLVVERPEEFWQVGTRRGFLKMLGLGGTILLLPTVFEACKDNSSTGPGSGNGVSLDLSTDTGILNYAYALEQLEAAFYTAVVASGPFSSFNAEQQEVFTDLRNHEVIHREFLRRALGNNAIGTLALNQSTVSAAIASTASILKNAEAFEDLGVSAYTGAGKYLTSATTLTVAGKIEFLPPGMRKSDVTPVGLAMTKDGKTAYVTLGHAAHVAVVDVASHKTQGYILVGKRAWGVTLSPDEKTLYVANGLGDDITIIDVASQKAKTSVPVGRIPWGIVIDE